MNVTLIDYFLLQNFLEIYFLALLKCNNLREGKQFEGFGTSKVAKLTFQILQNQFKVVQDIAIFVENGTHIFGYGTYT